MCEEKFRGTKEENPFVVVEVEYKMMGYYKRFKSREEYKEYDDGRRHLRNYCKTIHDNERSGRWSGDEVRKQKCQWMDDSSSWNQRWGEMYTPTDLRQMIECVMGDINPYVWFLWKNFEETETTTDDLGVVHHYKMEYEGE
jgi:hypothetical protein